MSYGAPVHERSETGKVPQEVILGYINGAGNHERKLVAAGVILADPQVCHTASTIRPKLNPRGDNGKPIWQIQAGEIDQYFSRSLEPIGAVIIGQTVNKNGKVVPSYIANPEYLKARLALTGFLAGWSLDYPAWSLQQLFGASNSTSEVHAPEVRYQLYLALLTGDEGTSLENLQDSLEGAGYQYGHAINGQLNDLSDLGFVTVSTTRRDYDPALEIVHTEHKQPGPRLVHNSRETQALYAAIRQLGAGAMTSVNGLVDLAVTIDPDIDDVKARVTLAQRTRPENRQTYQGLKRIDETGIPEGKFSSVHLVPEMREAVADLCNGIETIKDGTNLEAHIARARNILDRPEDIAALIAKAKRASVWHAAKEGRAVVEARFESIIREFGSVTVAAASEKLLEMHGRRISVAAARTILNGMADSGRIGVASQRYDPHARREGKVYVPADA